MFFKKSLQIVLFLFSSFLQGSVLPTEILGKIVGCLCDFDKIISLRCLNKDLNNLIGRIIEDEIQALKKSIGDENEIISPNFIAKKLRLLDASIQFQPIKAENYYGPNRHNPLSIDDQSTIKCMRYFIDQIIDEFSLALPLDERGISSDFVAEKLNLPNYTLFYKQYCFKSLFFLTRCAFRDSNDAIEEFKRATYKQYISLIDPYFKIEYSHKKTNITHHFFYNGEKEISLNKEMIKDPSVVFVPFILIIKGVLEMGDERFTDNPDILIDFESNKSIKIKKVIITIQSYIKTYNAQKKSLSLMAADMAIIKIQSLIRMQNDQQKIQKLHNAIETKKVITIQSYIKTYNTKEKSLSLIAAEKIEAQNQALLKQKLDNVSEQRKNNRNYRMKRFALISSCVLLAAFLFYFSFLQKRFFSVS
jgi:hypothetical protein